jgi:hypothetical protein
MTGFLAQLCCRPTLRLRFEDSCAALPPQMARSLDENLLSRDLPVPDANGALDRISIGLAVAKVHQWGGFLRPWAGDVSAAH